MDQKPRLLLPLISGDGMCKCIPISVFAVSKVLGLAIRIFGQFLVKLRDISYCHINVKSSSSSVLLNFSLFIYFNNIKLDN